MNKMKSKSIICMLLLSMMLGMSTSSCQDMLSPDSERHSYTVAEDTLYSYWGILKSLQNVAERYVILNECRGDLVEESGFVSDTIAPSLRFGMGSDAEKYKDGACAYLKISDYYHIINSCNAYIAMCDTSRTTGTNRKYMIKEYAQVQAIRAWVYMQLFYAYGPNRVPFYTEPMLTTDDINNFTANSNYPKVTPEALAEALAPDLERMEQVERMYGYPEYLNYGDAEADKAHFVCHSSRCMFPVSIVLGDLYLLKASASQSQTDYMKAATHYYNFLNSKYGGPLSVNNYISYGLLDDKRDNPLYSYEMLPTNADISFFSTNGNPFTEMGAASRELESITCIPSNEGKLEGKVLTDISRLFGFEAQMRTSGGESASAYVGLTPNYERQLLPSRGYEALCDSQKFEIYVGSYNESNGNVTYSTDTIEAIPGVGDARRAWIYSDNGAQWNFRVGDDLLYGKMVSKQNPGGIFTKTYPVVYRKSTVWLRFAEALNGAGFPSYAFAVLKTGLCSHSEWFPDDPATRYNNLNRNRKRWYAVMDYDGYDYEVTDSVYCYVDAATGDTIPSAGPSDTVLDLFDAVTSYFQDEYTASQDTESPMTEPRSVFDANGSLTVEALNSIRWAPKDANSFSNEPAFGGANAACYYLDRREVAKAASHPEFLDFNQPYLQGFSRTVMIPYKEQGKLLVTSGTHRVAYPTISLPGVYYTIGVHQRGCGLIYWDDPYRYRSSYNYVDQVAKKIKEKTGRDVTEKEIYSGSIDQEVKEAVEDLIIDEMALELAFEGSRFSDLCRASLHRGPEYLALRVAMRGGKTKEEAKSSSIYSHLSSSMNNWWLPIPEE